MRAERLMLGATFASVVAVAAMAHGGATGVVKERMDGMGAMKQAVKLLTPMMQGQTDYDPDVVRDQAAVIAAHAGETLTALFPAGSTEAPSEAKDTIWQDWAGFAALAERLGAAADGLGAAADNGLMMAGGTDAGVMMGGDVMGGNMMGGGMMGGGMMGDGPGAMDYAEMPADGAFTMLGQVCAACHSRFRVEK